MFIRNIILAALVAGASAGRLRIRDVSAPDTIKGVYFMEFEQGVNAIDTVKEYFGNLGVEATIRLSVSNSYTNAVSFAISGEHDQSLISDMPKAIDAFAVRTVSIPAPVSTEGIQEFAPEGFHSLTGVNEARSKLGLTGKGIKVGIIDTGVDYNHAALGGGFGPGKRVAFGYDFVGNAYNGDNGLIVPDNDPLDECAPSAHGTHVAGIVGADPRNITDPTWAASVAFTVSHPMSPLVHTDFGCEGSTATDIMAQAIYRAADDGCDIMNLSIGGGPTYNDGPAAVAATRVGEKGHFVFASAGNSGRSGSFASGSLVSLPEEWEWLPLITLKLHARSLGLVLPASNTVLGVSNNGRFPFGQEIEIVVNDLAADETNKQGDGSGPYPVAVPAPNLAGKGLLIRWGDTAVGGGSAARCNWAATYGAAYCILYSDTTELVSIGGSPIIAAVKAGQTPKIVVSQDLRLFGVPTAGTVSSFSSPGLDQDLLIKPDIGGIGGLVYSTISKFAQNNPSNPLKTPYDTKSGTSMASPYAAGVAALVLQALGRDRPTFDQLRTILQNSANPQKKFGTDLIDSVAYQGAGLINAFQAVTSKTLVYPSRLALNDTQNINQHYRLTVTNKATPL
ncbi:peptidase S8/S53 domain-containing protein [Chytridium lagenaria]|nr:peptidase S8/S53 domain-containing protein [Chytridium lagenaria]